MAETNKKPVGMFDEDIKKLKEEEKNKEHFPKGKFGKPFGILNKREKVLKDIQ